MLFNKSLFVWKIICLYKKDTYIHPILNWNTVIVWMWPNEKQNASNQNSLNEYTSGENENSNS